MEEVKPDAICGQLTVIECLQFDRAPSIRKWRCRCSCGREHEAREQHLRTGHVVRCGNCARLQRNATLKQTKARSLKSGNTQHVLYPVWQSQIQRCENPSSKDYEDYGGRGISFYSKWRHCFQAFARYIESELGPKPSPGHTIDRIDNEGNYEPGNLRWATYSEQNRNKRMHYV